MALRHLLAGLTLLPALALTGCGQKGALYLPDQAPSPRAAEAGCRTPSCAAMQQTGEDEKKDRNTPEATDPTTPDETPE